jgi:hypothetical protein
VGALLLIAVQEELVARVVRLLILMPELLILQVLQEVTDRLLMDEATVL